MKARYRQQHRAEWLAIQAEESQLPILSREIWYLPLSYRARHCLTRYGRIETVEELIARSEIDLLKLKDLGRKTRDEILAFLQIHGFTVRRIGE